MPMAAIRPVWNFACLAFLDCTQVLCFLDIVEMICGDLWRLIIMMLCWLVTGRSIEGESEQTVFHKNTASLLILLTALLSPETYCWQCRKSGGSSQGWPHWKLTLCGWFEYFGQVLAFYLFFVSFRTKILSISILPVQNERTTAVQCCLSSSSGWPDGKRVQGNDRWWVSGEHVRH